MTDLAILPPGVTSAADLHAHYVAVRKRLARNAIVKPVVKTPAPDLPHKRDWLVVATPAGEAVPLRKVYIAALQASGLLAAEFSSERRWRQTGEWRQAYYYVARKVTRASYIRIGKTVGGRDHTTVHYGIQVVSNDPKRFASHVNAILEALAIPEHIVAHSIPEGDTEQ